MKKQSPTHFLKQHNLDIKTYKKNYSPISLIIIIANTKDLNELFVHKHQKNDTS